MAEKRVPEQQTAGKRVLMYTRPASVRQAKAMLKRVTPYPLWVRQQPRSTEARKVYLVILRELAAIIAGQRPDVIKTVGGGSPVVARRFDSLID